MMKSAMDRNRSYQRIDDDLEQFTDDSISLASLKSPNKYNLFFICCAIISAILLTVGFNYRNQNNVKFNSSLIESSIAGTVIKVFNIDYPDTSTDMFSYPFLQNSYLMEPHRENTVSVSLNDDSFYCSSSQSLSSIETVNSCLLQWTLTKIDTDDDATTISGCALDSSFTVQPVATGQYSLTITRKCNNGLFGKVGSFNVWVKYVRREVRSLTDYDRSEFLDAFRTLWDVSTLDGQKLYGDNYKSLFYFATIHNDASAPPSNSCDEFHGKGVGYGFVSNHLYLGAYLEQSLQLVNPRVALHYLEYVDLFSSNEFLVDHLQNTMDGGTWTEILSEKYFGANDPITGRIINSRWENSSIPFMDDDFFVREGIDNTCTFFPAEANVWKSYIHTWHRSSPSGLLRAPWNLNPVTFTTRYNNVNRLDFSKVDKKDLGLYLGTSCDSYSDLVQNYAVGKTFEDYLTHAEDSSHGPIHFAFGGSGGQNCFEKDQLLRERYHLTTEILVSIARSSQSFFKSHECADIAFTSEAAFSVLVTLYFSDAPGATLPSYLLDTTVEFSSRTELMQTICDRRQFDSDMQGSGAATDPLFWVSHGAVERLMQRVVFEDVLTDYTYPKQQGGCSGHISTGTKYWLKGFFFEDKSVNTYTLTNAALTSILVPTTDEYRDYINYVYDKSDFTMCQQSASWFGKN